MHRRGSQESASSAAEEHPEHLVEEPYDVERLLALFEESNRLYQST